MYLGPQSTNYLVRWIITRSILTINFMIISNNSFLSSKKIISIIFISTLQFFKNFKAYLLIDTFLQENQIRFD